MSNELRFASIQKELAIVKGRILDELKSKIEIAKVDISQKLRKRNLEVNHQNAISHYFDDLQKFLFVQQQQIFIVMSYCDLESCACLLGGHPNIKGELSHWPGQANIVIRSMLELVIHHVFIACSVSDRMLAFNRSNWREVKIHYDDMVLSAPDPRCFSKSKADLLEYLDKDESSYMISPMEKADPFHKIQQWPLVSTIVKQQNQNKSKKHCYSIDYKVDKDSLDLLKYLKMWMYGVYSSNNHNGIFGWGDRFSPQEISLRDVIRNQAPEQNIEHCSNTARGRAYLMILMLLSEVVSHNKIHLYKRDLRRLWGNLEAWGEPKELFQMRYDNLLAH